MSPNVEPKHLLLRNLEAKIAALPMIATSVFIFLGCTLWSVVYSFTKSRSLPVEKFVGFDQYDRLFNTPRLLVSVENIAIYGICTLVFSLLIGFLLAALLDQKIRFENTFRTIFLYPFALSFVVTGLVWQWLLNPEFGIQQVVRDMGFEEFVFNPLRDRDWAIYGILVAGLWQSTGLVVVLMLAGLRGIEEDIWKAAKIDGIPTWKTYILIVIPMMKPVFVTTLVLIAAGIVKLYDLVIAQTSGGPGTSTEVPAKFVYDFIFLRGNLGQGLAASTMMLGMVLIILIPWMWLEYGGKKKAMIESAAMTTSGPRGARPKPIFSPRNIMIYGVLIIASIYYLLPLYVMIVTSLKGMPEVRLGNIFSSPLEITFYPWVKAWDQACTGLYCEGLKVGFVNSMQIMIPSVILSIGIASINGYALANWKFKGSEVFFTILLFGAFIPYQVMIYPLVIILRELGLFGSLAGVTLIHTIFGMPILTLLFRNYFSSIPVELFKVARVDGAGFWGIFIKIMLPMSIPIIVVAVILQITDIWNDFLFGVIYAGTKNFPMTVQLNNIVNSTQGVKEYNVNMAATILTGLVPLFIYFVSGKFFVRGIAAGAVKG